MRQWTHRVENGTITGVTNIEFTLCRQHISYVHKISRTTSLYCLLIRKLNYTYVASLSSRETVKRIIKLFDFQLESWMENQTPQLSEQLNHTTYQSYNTDSQDEFETRAQLAIHFDDILPYFCLCFERQSKLIKIAKSSKIYRIKPMAD